MPKTDHTFNNAIAEFFSRTEIFVTRVECDEFAAHKFGDPVCPVPLQGASSYTVRAGPDKIVQFREPGSTLDEKTLALARETHPDVVACYEIHGFVGGSSEDAGEAKALCVYTMNNLPGTNYIMVRAELAESLPLHLATVRSLARFFAQSWLSARPSEAQVNIAIDGCTAMIRRLPDELPSRFAPFVAQVQRILPMLRSRKHPVVFTHADLNETNILVNPISGEITGVVDWAEAGFLPFGFALYALDTTLGGMGRKGWKYFNNAEYLRDEFWRAFEGLVGGLPEDVMESIRMARVFGLLVRYGTSFDEGSGKMVGARDSSGGSLRYLDALLLGRCGEEGEPLEQPA